MCYVIKYATVNFNSTQSLPNIDFKEFLYPSDWDISYFDGQTGECRVYVVLHGCHFGGVYIGTAFIENRDYLKWAATYHIALLFP